MDWPAARFFLKDLERRVRLMQLKEALLVALRTAILLGLALALLRPGERGESPGPGRAGGTRGAVILLDNSLSMDHRAAAEEASAWERARGAALEVIGSLLPGDLVQVASLAGTPAALSPRPLSNLEDARAAVREVALLAGECRVPDALELGADLAAGLPPGEREVYLLTDLQARGWMASDRPRWDLVAGRLRALQPPAKLLVVDVGAEGASNRAVVALGLSPAVAGTDREVEISAAVEAFGGGAEGGVEVSLVVDGVSRERRAVEPRAGAALVARFRHRFTAPGQHRVEARLAADGLAADDSRRLAVEALAELPVLIVAESRRPAPGPGDGWSAAEVLDLALAPRTAEAPAPAVVFRPRVIAAAELGDLSSAELLRLPVVMVAGVSVLEAAQAQRLEEYVRAGGGLLLFAGERAIATAWNGDLHRSGRGALPAALGSLEGGPGGGEEALGAAGFLDGHPGLAELGPRVPDEVGEVKVRRWWRVEPAAGSTTIARLKGGAPLLIERPCGRGRALLALTGASIAESDLPRSPHWVPLLHGLVYHLARKADRNLTVGGRLIERVEEEAVAARASVADPSGSARPAALEPAPEGEGDAGGRLAFSFGPVHTPGFYTLEIEARGEKRTALFAANLDPAESDVRRIGGDDLGRIAGLAGFSVVRDLAQLAPPAGAPRARREWWRPILALTLALAVLEVLATRALGRGRAPWRPPAAPDGPPAGSPVDSHGSA